MIAVRLLVTGLLCALAALAAQDANTVVDPGGAAVPNAVVQVETPLGAPVTSRNTGATGQFSLEGIPAGSYRLRVTAAGFGEAEVRALIPGDPVTVPLSIQAESGSVTVSAVRGRAEDAPAMPALIQMRGPNALRARPLTTVADVLSDTAGVMVQATTNGHASPFLRGMTGYQTLILLDGIRFNTSLFRSGPNQNISFVDPAHASSVEVSLGPAGAAYGSDAMGGMLAVQTSSPRFDPGAALHGEAETMLASADVSGTLRTRLAFTSDKFWLHGAGSIRRLNDLRAGAGEDSHHVFRRYFGLSGEQVRTLTGDRLQDTAFTQPSAALKFALRPTPSQLLTGMYQRTDLLGLRSYRDLMGGLGRLQARFDPQAAQFAYLRYENFKLPALDSLAATFSANLQRDGSIRQGPLATDSVILDDTSADVYGFGLQASTHVGRNSGQVFGGEVYHELLGAASSQRNPVNGQLRETRPLIPNGSRYRQWGLYGQNVTELLSGRLRVLAGARLTGVQFETFSQRNVSTAGQPFGVADSTYDFSNVSLHFNAALRLTANLTVFAQAAQAFRAPSANDLGAVGLSGLGFEVPIESAIQAGAILADTSAENALPLRRPLRELRPERMITYEAGALIRTSRTVVRLQSFFSPYRDPITRRTLLFPEGQAPATLYGMAVSPLPQTSAQRAAGVVTVANAADPRSIKAFVNDGRARYYGGEATLKHELTRKWAAESYVSFLNARTLDPNRVIRRLPPVMGGLSLRGYLWRGMWMQVAAQAAAPQDRLNPADYDDERIGASRRRADIATFFTSAAAAPFIRGSVFQPTGETLRQIQDRVLPLGAVINGVAIANDQSRVPMLDRTAGWTTLNLNFGVPLGERLTVRGGVANIFDSNYRVHGSGVDGAGRNLFAGLRYAF